MSELQAALLAIGFGVIVAVYGFGWWQQKQYRQKFAAMFKVSHADALHHVGRAPLVKQTSPSALADMVEQAVVATASQADISDQPCALLNPHSDFIIELSLATPGPAAVLVGLWQRKFDFSKPVQVCGLALTTGQWERVIAESHALYQRFRVALQLVDRSGVISAAKLADFRDLVSGVAKHIKAEATIPDVHTTHQHAVELDAFCATVDQMVGVNLVPAGDRLIRAASIAQAANLLGMTLEADGAFHLLDEQGNSLFSLINQDTVPFQYHTLETFSTAGITLLLDVPCVENPTRQFDRMMGVARDLAREFQANVVDDHRVTLSDIGLANTRTQVAGVEDIMRNKGILPGSAQARRLFS